MCCAYSRGGCRRVSSSAHGNLTAGGGAALSSHQRSSVQIQPPQPRRDEGLAVFAADPFVVSAPILHPLHRVSDDVGAAVAVLSEHLSFLKSRPSRLSCDLAG